MGIRQKIKEENDAEKIFQIMDGLNSYVKELCDKYVVKNLMEYSQIADGVIIVADLALADEMYAIIAEIQWRILIFFGMLARGAITIGEVGVFEPNAKIIGPAYVDVYALESENAIFPRTIVTEDYIGLLKKEGQLPGCILLDNDKTYYIDYIKYIQNKFRISSHQLKEMLIQYQIKKMLNNGLKNDKFKIKQKYGWLLLLLKRNGVEL